MIDPPPGFVPLYYTAGGDAFLNDLPLDAPFWLFYPDGCDSITVAAGEPAIILSCLQQVTEAPAGEGNPYLPPLPHCGPAEIEDCYFLHEVRDLEVVYDPASRSWRWHLGSGYFPNLLRPVKPTAWKPCPKPWQ